MKYIDADLLRKEIDRQKIGYNTDGKHTAWDEIDYPDEQKYYEEVLDRFNKQRNGKEIR